MLQLGKLDLQLRTSENDTQVIVRLYGRDASRLIEGHGELIDALQVLANKALVGRRLEKDIELDCQEFKGKRVEELEQKAREVADRVRRDGREQLLPAMTPIAVDLPAPFGPISPVIEPRSTVKEAPLTARTPTNVRTRSRTISVWPPNPSISKPSRSKSSRLTSNASLSAGPRCRVRGKSKCAEHPRCRKPRASPISSPSPPAQPPTHKPPPQ